MINNILKFDYALSRWFSRTSDKIIPGTAFLFLNKVSFVWAMVFFSIATTLGLNKSINLFVGIAAVGTLIIMYGLQKPMERYIIEKTDFHVEYASLSIKKIATYRLIGLLIMFLSFGIMLLIGILFMSTWIATDSLT